MLRFTVLLIVVTLTGLPVLPAACLSWCGEHRTTLGFCHNEAVKNGLPIVVAATDTCTALLTDGTFILEEARPVLHAVHNLPVFEASAPLATAFAGHRPSAMEARPQAPLVLRV